MRKYGSWTEQETTVFRTTSDNKELTLTPPATLTGASLTLTYPDISSGTTDTMLSRTSTDTLTNKTFDVDGTGNSLTNIADANIKAGAAISVSKLAALTPTRALVSDGSGVVSASAVTSTELGYLSGVGSAIQTQIDGKASTALNNLAAVAINTSLISDTDNTDNLGSAAIAWANGYINTLLLDSNSQTTTITGSPSASASVNYILPPAGPAVNGYVLSATTAGIMSWVVQSGGGTGGLFSDQDGSSGDLTILGTERKGGAFFTINTGHTYTVNTDAYFLTLETLKVEGTLIVNGTVIIHEF